MKKALLNGLESIISNDLDKYGAPTVTQHCGTGKFSKCDSARILKFMTTLRRLELWPLATAIDQISLHELLLKLSKAWSPSKQRTKKGCGCSPGLKSLVLKEIDRVKGMCLYCVKDGKLNVEMNCWMAHGRYWNITS